MKYSGGGRSLSGGRAHSYIHVHRLQKQLISKEINNAEHKYMNMCRPT